jgi:hypothetical protein
VLERLVPFFGSDATPATCAASCACRAFCISRTLATRSRSARSGSTRSRTPSSKLVMRSRGSQTRPNISDISARLNARLSATLARRHEQQPLQAARSRLRSLWEAIWSLDCEEGLRAYRGIGLSVVRSTRSRRQVAARLNIYVDGKSRVAGSTQRKRIGSLDGGGPTLVQWLKLVSTRLEGRDRSAQGNVSRNLPKSTMRPRKRGGRNGCHRTTDYNGVCFVASRGALGHPSSTAFTGDGITNLTILKVISPIERSAFERRFFEVKSRTTSARVRARRRDHAGGSH